MSLTVRRMAPPSDGAIKQTATDLKAEEDY